MAVVAGFKKAQGVIMRSLAAWYDVAARLGKIFTRKAYPLHRNENISPFFIIGAGRSGTTLLRRILVASKQVHIPPETYVLAQVIEHYSRNAYKDWPTLVRDCMALFEMHPEFDTFQITLRPLLPKLYILPESERSLAKMLDMFYRYHAEQTGVVCEYWGDKTPINTFALDDIYAVFPKAKFIHLLRDGVDVVHSCVQRGLVPNLKDAAFRWQDALKAVECFRKKHKEACLDVRYEALVSQPDELVHSLCDWLKVDYKSSMIDENEHTAALGDMDYRHYESSLEKVSSKHIGQGRKALTLQDQHELQALIGKDLQRLGYAPANESQA